VRSRTGHHGCSVFLGLRSASLAQTAKAVERSFEGWHALISEHRTEMGAGTELRASPDPGREVVRAVRAR